MADYRATSIAIAGLICHSEECDNQPLAEIAKLIAEELIVGLQLTKLERSGAIAPWNTVDSRKDALTVISSIRHIFVTICVQLVDAIKNNNEPAVRSLHELASATLHKFMVYRIKKRPRRSWVRPLLTDRQTFGEYHHLFRDMRAVDRRDFFLAVRMTPERFDDLKRRIAPRLQKQDTHMRLSITPGEQLAVTLRYLAHGDSQRMLALSFRLGTSTVCTIIRRTLQAIWDILTPDYLKVPSQAEFEQIALQFGKVWNFPNCVGSIDGKHVVIQAPACGGSEFFNYKGSHSLVLMAVCSADYRFTMVDIGSSGHQSDGGVFAASAFGKKIYQETLPLPPPAVLRGTDIRLPYVFVGDEAFPLLRHLMRPFPGKHLPMEEAIFNYRLSRARRMIENTFGILASRWRIFRRSIIADVKTVELILMATVCLHNYLTTMDKQEMISVYCPPGYVDYEDLNGELQRGQWRDAVSQEDALRDISTMGRNQYTRVSKAVRKAFMSYFCSNAGEVNWQYETVIRGKHPSV